MSRRDLLSLILVSFLIIAFTLAACVPTESPQPSNASPAEATDVSEPEPPETSTEVGEVVIGLVYPTTGAVSVIGQAMVNGHNLAADYINAAGGIKSLGGAKLIFKVGDTQGKPEIGISQVRRLVEQEKVSAIMGAYQSGVTLPTTQLAEELQVPHLVPIGAADNISERGFKYTFKISPKGSLASYAELDFLKEMSDTSDSEVKTVAFVYIDNLYGQQQTEVLKKIMPEYPFEIVADLAYPENTSDVSGVIAKLKAANPDVVLQSSYVQDGILLSRALNDQNWSPPKAWMGFGGNAADPQFFESVGNQAENYFTLTFWTPGLVLPETAGLEKAVSEYKSRYGSAMDEYSAVAYTATYVLADAIERAASIVPEDIRNALTTTDIKVGTEGNLFHFDITFPPDGQTPSNFIVAQYRSDLNKSVKVWPVDSPDDFKPVWPAPLGTQK